MAALRKLASLAQDAPRCGVTQLGIVAEAQTYTIAPPVRAYAGPVDPRDPRWKDNFRATVEGHAPAVEMFRIEGAFVTPNAAILTRNGMVVAESLYPYVRTADVDTAFRPFLVHEPGSPQTEFSVLIRNLTLIAGDVVFAREHGEIGYFHWLHSVLPRLLLTRVGQPGVRSLIAPIEAFQRESLQHAGIPAHDLVVADGNTAHCDGLIYCSPMVCPDLARSGGFFERSLLPSALLRGLAPPNAGTRRLLISRQDAAIRRLLGEDDIAARLQDHGFEVVTLNGMRFSEQIDLFASASVVVGSHGAGLSNVAFMREGSLVVEILAPDRLWPTYRGVAARSGLHYAPYVGERAGTIGERDSDLAVEPANFVDFVLGCVASVGPAN